MLVTKSGPRGNRLARNRMAGALSRGVEQED